MFWVCLIRKVSIPKIPIPSYDWTCFCKTTVGELHCKWLLPVKTICNEFCTNRQLSVKTCTSSRYTPSATSSSSLTNRKRSCISLPAGINERSYSYSNQPFFVVSTGSAPPLPIKSSVVHAVPSNTLYVYAINTIVCKFVPAPERECRTRPNWKSD